MKHTMLLVSFSLSGQETLFELDLFKLCMMSTSIELYSLSCQFGWPWNIFKITGEPQNTMKVVFSHSEWVFGCCFFMCSADRQHVISWCDAWLVTVEWICFSDKQQTGWSHAADHRTLRCTRCSNRCVGECCFALVVLIWVLTFLLGFFDIYV